MACASVRYTFEARFIGVIYVIDWLYILLYYAYLEDTTTKITDSVFEVCCWQCCYSVFFEYVVVVVHGGLKLELY